MFFGLLSFCNISFIELAGFSSGHCTGSFNDESPAKA